MLSFLSCTKGGLEEPLRVEDSIPKYRGPGSPISVSAAPLCPDADMWKLCRFLGNMLRALTKLPGGLGRFIPGRIGANHGRLSHVGWEKCCHGLTCRPRESSSEGFFCDFFLSLVGVSSLVWWCLAGWDPQAQISHPSFCS